MNFMKQKIFFALIFFFIWLSFGMREGSPPAMPGSPRLIPLGENLVKVEHDNGEYQIFNMTRIHSSGSTAKKIIRFNIAKYDPEQFSHIFNYFTSIPIGNDSFSALSVDTDKDSLIELVGIFKDYDDDIFTRNSIVEQISLKSHEFESALDYIGDYRSALVLVSDVNSNGKNELVSSILFNSKFF